MDRRGWKYPWLERRAYLPLMAPKTATYVMRPHEACLFNFLPLNSHPPDGPPAQFPPALAAQPSVPCGEYG